MPNPESRAVITTLRAGALLALFALAGTTLVAATHTLTRERIADNERRALLDTIDDVLPARLYDNDLFTDQITVTDADLLGTSDPVPVFRARRAGRPVAVVMTPVAPDGYNGDIHLLIAILRDGTISGVRVLSHKETPGLGDNIEVQRSDWIKDFSGRSLGDPPVTGWAVQRDGGIFDQFTGATITPRAVVKEVKNTLQYFDQHTDMLFDAPAATPARPENNHG